MQPIRLELGAEELRELDRFYRKAGKAYLRTRAQMILLAGEQGLVAGEIATLTRTNEETVRRWMKRYRAEGLNGLLNRPRSGSPGKVTPAYKERLLEVVRRRPRSMGLEFSLWTLQRLADFLAEETGIRVSDETVRLHLLTGGIKMSRPQHKITSPDPEYELKKRRSSASAST